MQYNITAPSKTFLLGEYAVLKGGPSILLSTAPSFSMHVFPDSIGNHSDFHPNSPAGKWIKKRNDFYSAYSFKFMDPHRGLGGFGASSAQFLMLYGFIHYVNGTVINEWEMIQKYKECSQGSGADVMAQFKGGFCLYHPAEQKVETHVWPFPDLEYGMIHTGHKLATYEHLESLIKFETSALSAIEADAYKSIENKDSERFIDAVQRYGFELNKQGLLFSETEKILKKIHLCTEIKASKGCGALGVDVIFILFYKEKRAHVLGWIEQEGLKLITYGQQTAKGLLINEL